MRSRLALGGGSGLLLVAVLVFAANLRGPIAALGPVVGDVTAELALSPAAVGLLTGLPVLCFALAAPLASGFIGRFGVGRAVTVSLLVIIVGTVLRSVAGFPTAVVGTLLLGVAITIGNIAVPVVTRRDFPLVIAGVTGAYTAAMNLGAMTTTAFTAPIAQSLGWRWALGVWSILAVAALVLWLVALRVRRTQAAGGGAPDGRVDDGAGAGTGEPGGAVVGVVVPEIRTPPFTPVLRRPFIWTLAAVFGMQSFGYYGMTAWLPQLLSDQIGLDQAAAGGGAAPFQAAAVVSALTVPVVLARRIPARVVFLGLIALWLALPLGIFLAPGAWLVWVTCSGLAQGGLFTVVMSVVLQRASSVADARRSSAAVQSIGYLFAATGPSVLGALNASSGSWTLPLATLLVGFSLAAFAGSYAMRPAR